MCGLSLKSTRLHWAYTYICNAFYTPIHIGHGYPVPVAPTSRPASPSTTPASAAAVAKAGILSALLKPSKKAARAGDAPEYRFISSMVCFLNVPRDTARTC